MANTSDWVYDDFSGGSSHPTNDSENSVPNVPNVTNVNPWTSYPIGSDYNVWMNFPPSDFTNESQHERIETPDSLPDLEPVTPTNSYPQFMPSAPARPSRVPPSRPAPRIEKRESEDKFGRFEIILASKSSPNDSGFYLNMLDVFNYVTLGSNISDEYYEVLNNFICQQVFGVSVDHLDSSFKLIEKRISFSGRSYDRTLVLYNWNHYGVIASSILQWATTNPEKIAGY
jgi:hypothetical protein